MEVESRGTQRLRLHVPYVRHEVRRQDAKAQLRQIVSDGISSFKIFLAYKNFFGVDDAEMYQTLALARKLGVITTAHCENAELVSRLQQTLLEARPNRPRVARTEPPGISRSRRNGDGSRHFWRTRAQPDMSSISPAQPALERAMAAKSERRSAFISKASCHTSFSTTLTRKDPVAKD